MTPDWKLAAACALSGQDPNLWWSADLLDRAIARKICRGCPVLTHCQEASTGERWGGIWGGQLRPDITSSTEARHKGAA